MTANRLLLCATGTLRAVSCTPASRQQSLFDSAAVWLEGPAVQWRAMTAIYLSSPCTSNESFALPACAHSQRSSIAPRAQRASPATYPLPLRKSLPQVLPCCLLSAAQPVHGASRLASGAVFENRSALIKTPLIRALGIQGAACSLPPTFSERAGPAATATGLLVSLSPAITGHLPFASTGIAPCSLNRHWGASLATFSKPGADYATAAPAPAARAWNLQCAAGTIMS